MIPNLSSSHSGLRLVFPGNLPLVKGSRVKNYCERWIDPKESVWELFTVRLSSGVMRKAIGLTLRDSLSPSLFGNLRHSSIYYCVDGMKRCVLQLFPIRPPPPPPQCYASICPRWKCWACYRYRQPTPGMWGYPGLLGHVGISWVARTCGDILSCSDMWGYPGYGKKIFNEIGLAVTLL